MIDIHGILRILPHRYPFVMIDRVLECEPGKRVVALRNVSINEPYFIGHFPGDPVMPGVLIVEAMAQAGAILAHESGTFDPAKHAVYFIGIDGVRFRRAVRPGDQLIIEVESLRSGSRVWKMRGVARVGGEVAAEGELMASIVPKPAN